MSAVPNNTTAILVFELLGFGPATSSAMFSNVNLSNTVTVDVAPTISSVNAATFTVGTTGSFTVMTNGGFPLPAKLSQNITLPSGLSFVDQSNGTAILSGKPAAGTGGSYAFTITAANNDSTFERTMQPFTLTIKEAPSITSVANATFTVGTMGSFTVMTGGGFPLPAKLTQNITLPSGLVLRGPGQRARPSLSGKACGAGTGGSYTFTITAANNDSSLGTTQPFTLTIKEAPSITSVANATFTVGSMGSFTVTTSGGFALPAKLSQNITLPSGITFVDPG